MRAEASMAYLVPYEQASFMLSLQIVQGHSFQVLQRFAFTGLSNA